MVLEIALRGRLALALDRLGAVEIALQLRIGKVDGVEHPARQRPGPARNNKLEIGPASLARALDQARFREQLQMPADPRLALPEDARQVLHIEFARREQHQDAQPRWFRGGFQDGDDVLRRQGHENLSLGHLTSESTQ